MKRALIAVIGTVGCAFGIWQAITIGYARNLAHDAAPFNDLAAAEKAVRWAPRDAEPSSVRGLILQRTGNYPDAALALERSIQLRPRDYFLWMLLGVTRDLNQDSSGAISALQQSVAAAPIYARPRWLLGNVLLRSGRTEEAFRELRLAGRSDETLWPNVIDLAWGIYGRDAARTVSAIDPQTDNARLFLAMFFARHRQPAAAVAQFRNVSQKSMETAEAFVNELMNARSFAEAWEVWRSARGISDTSGALLNPGFEEDIVVGQTGFGWQIANVANVTPSADAAQPQSGSKSLHIDFRGESNPAATIVSQVLIVQPQTNYRLTFQARTTNFVSIGNPVIQVLDASDERLLKQSEKIASGKDWHEFAVEFTTGPQTNAVRIALLRQSCANNPCPAFGSLWLDSFDIKALAMAARVAVGVTHAE